MLSLSLPNNIRNPFLGLTDAQVMMDDIDLFPSDGNLPFLQILPINLASNYYLLNRNNIVSLNSYQFFLHCTLLISFGNFVQT